MAPATTTTRITHLQAFIFAAKAATAAVLAMVIFDLLGLPEGIWAAVSAVIVTEPSLHPSAKSSLTRVIANLVGAFTGSVLCVFLGHTILAVALGVFATGLICHYTRLDDAVRPAYAAVVIVMFATGKNVWVGSLDRVGAVIIGCLCALMIGFLVDKGANLLGFREKKDQPGGST
jgi:uncharacterized membrane protein YgaE (UPF0421/DUF939 family)